MSLSYTAILIHNVKDESLFLDVLRQNSDAAADDMYPSFLHPSLSIDPVKANKYLGWMWLGVPTAAWARGEDNPPPADTFVADGVELARAWWGEVYLRVGRRYALTRLCSPVSGASRLLLQEPLQDQLRLILCESHGLAAMIDTEEESFQVLAPCGSSDQVYWPEWHWTRPPAPPFDEVVGLVLDRLAASES